jgi:hypothetical protein
LGSNVDDVVNGKAGLEGDLLFRRIDLEVTIQAEITDDRDAEIGVTPGEFVETGGRQEPGELE